MEVLEWQNSPGPGFPNKRARYSSLSPAFVGIFGTLLLHVLAFESLNFGQGLRPKVLVTLVPAGTGSKSTETSAENLLLIALPIVPSTNPLFSGPPLTNIRSETAITVDPPALPKLEMLVLGEDKDSSMESDSGDAAERERLIGIYTGQIQARIDRIWRRPRAPIDDSTSESFQCQAQIVQDVHGNVQEILLPTCNGSQSWQRSLVIAIQQASPLPAPPSASVFSRSVTLSFVGVPFSVGSAEDEYELPPRNLARAQDSSKP